MKNSDEPNVATAASKFCKRFWSNRKAKLRERLELHHDIDSRKAEGDWCHDIQSEIQHLMHSKQKINFILKILSKTMDLS